MPTLNNRGESKKVARNLTGKTNYVPNEKMNTDYQIRTSDLIIFLVIQVMRSTPELNRRVFTC